MKITQTAVINIAFQRIFYCIFLIKLRRPKNKSLYFSNELPLTAETLTIPGAWELMKSRDV